MRFPWVLALLVLFSPSLAKAEDPAVALRAELRATLANTELMPAGLNLRKAASVGPRQVALAQEL